MNLPDINIREFEDKKNRNKQERLKFIDMYTDWLKKTPNEIWSKQHAAFIDSGIIIANACKKNNNMSKS